MARNGVRIGRVTVVDEDYVRLDVPSISASGQAYLYFPTLTWRVWENHPFSVAGSLLTEAPADGQPCSNRTDVEKIPTQHSRTVDFDSGSDALQTTPHRSTHKTQSGLTFFVRTHTGVTRHLRDRKTLPVLVECSYGHSLLHNQHAELDPCPNLICIAGGVGITAILPLLGKHAGNRKLYWGLRNRALADAVQDIFDSDALAAVQRHVSVGERLDLQVILKDEIGRAEKCAETVAIVVSGPATMADEVRVTVARLARGCEHAEVVFVEECYSW